MNNNGLRAQIVKEYKPNTIIAILDCKEGAKRLGKSIYSDRANLIEPFAAKTLQRWKFDLLTSIN